MLALGTLPKPAGAGIAAFLARNEVRVFVFIGQNLQTQANSDVPVSNETFTTPFQWLVSRDVFDWAPTPPHEIGS